MLRRNDPASSPATADRPTRSLRRLAGGVWAAAALALLAGGGAHAATRGYEVTDFTRLRVDGAFDVRVRTGVPTGVRATGPQAAIDRLIVEQHGDTLVIRPVRTPDMTARSREQLVVEIGTHRLDGATLSGSGTVAIDRARGDALDLQLGGSGDLSVGEVDVARLRLSLNGSGDLTVGGHARQADALLVGAGDLHGRALTAEVATVKLVGSGDAALGARHSAAIDMTGSGSVSISGPATCTTHRTGSGEVHCEGGGG